MMIVLASINLLIHHRFPYTIHISKAVALAFRHFLI
jgi:hypothetical protein